MPVFYPPAVSGGGGGGGVSISASWIPVTPVRAVGVGGYVPGYSSSVSGGASPAVGTQYGIPFIPAQSFTADQVMVEVTTAAGAGGTIRLGVYDSNAANLLPNALLADWGTAATTATGIQTVTIGSPFAFVAGTAYWLSYEQAVANASYRGFSLSQYPAFAANNASEALSAARVFASWTRSAGAFATWGATGYAGNSNEAVAIAFRRSA